MAKPPKVLIINGNGEYRKMFLDRGWALADYMTEADLVQFTGGEDVTPALYGQKQHPTTRCNSVRDRIEVGMFAMAQKMGIPVAGICRGGQFCNVMCGGKMYQHVTNHACGSHVARDVFMDQEFPVTSTHHQMMLPGQDATILVTAALSSSRQVMSATGPVYVTGGANSPGEPDIEVVAYENQGVLCFQPHPEFEGWSSLANIYFSYITDILFGGIDPCVV